MKNKGFTLIEVVVVLFLTCFILMIGFQFSKKSINQIREEQFIKNLAGKIDESTVEGHDHHQIVVLTFFKSNVYVRVGDHQEKIKYPPTLTKYGAQSVYIASSGVVRPVTIPLVDKDHHYVYRFIFQLSFGGVYRIVKEKL